MSRPGSRGPKRNAPTGRERTAARPLWEILFEDDLSTEEYARQIDYFQIEIGAVAKNGTVEYIGPVSGRKPERRSGLLESDPRVRIGWRKGTLPTADRKLLGKAGISTKDKDLMHFLPDELQQDLAELEHDYAGRKPEDIRRTRFRLRPKTDGEGYEIVVSEQVGYDARSQNRPDRK